MKLKINYKLIITLDLLAAIIAIVMMRFFLKASDSDFATTMSLFAPIVMMLEFLHMALAFCISSLLLGLLKKTNRILALIVIKGLFSLCLYMLISICLSTESIFVTMWGIFMHAGKFMNFTLPYLIGLMILLSLMALMRNKLFTPLEK